MAATKRTDAYALQVRLNDSEVERLDRWIRALQQDRPGSSGVSRSTVMRDLLVAEMDRRDGAILRAKQATALSADLAAFIREFDPESLKGSKLGKALTSIHQSIELLEWVAKAKLHSSIKAANVVADDRVEEEWQDEEFSINRDLVVSRLYIRMLGAHAALSEFFNEVRLIYGDIEP